MPVGGTSVREDAKIAKQSADKEPKGQSNIPTKATVSMMQPEIITLEKTPELEGKGGSTKAASPQGMNMSAHAIEEAQISAAVADTETKNAPNDMYISKEPVYADAEDEPQEMLFKVATGIAEAGAYHSKSQASKAITLREGNHKRTFYANRKVAIVEELHFQKSGRSLQQQMDTVQAILKLQVQKVGDIEERGATKGDIDALSKSKVDTSEANLTSLRMETRIRDGLAKKIDIVTAEKALRKKVNLVDLKGRVKSFVQPLV
eukprot:g4634.t1